MKDAGHPVVTVPEIDHPELALGIFMKGNEEVRSCWPTGVCLTAAFKNTLQCRRCVHGILPKNKHQARSANSWDRGYRESRGHADETLALLLKSDREIFSSFLKMGLRPPSTFGLAH